MTRTPELEPSQLARLQKILEAGFRLMRIPHVERYLTVERNGFVALLDPSGGGLSLLGQVGYLLGEGIGMLVEREGRRVFVWKQESREATPEMVAEYEQFKEDIEEQLNEPSAA